MKGNFGSITVLLVVALTGFSARRLGPFTLSEPVAVIELFSSQGCSSCPPADALLSRTILKTKDGSKNIFALTFHVDYWDRLGWKDPFSDAKFSERQRNYAEKLGLNSVYTPQMIVNGTREFVGSDEKKLEKAIAEALAVKPLIVFEKTSLSFTEHNVPRVNYQLNSIPKNAVLNFALVSLKETTTIRRGENSGKTLVNENVVRQFISKEPTQMGSMTFADQPRPDNSNLAVIGYLQDKTTLKITDAFYLRP